MPATRVLFKQLASISVQGKSFLVDPKTNVTRSILDHMSRSLYKIPNHPLQILKSEIERHFATKYPNTFELHDSMHPVVSVTQNFDELLFPEDHPGRSSSDTYYINKDHVLRTHTSAHQMEIMKRKSSSGYLLSSDVYRRDQIDASHYPVFHQMEGIRLFDRKQGLPVLPENGLSDEFMPSGEVKDTKENPFQRDLSIQETLAVSAHLRSTLEGLVRELFSSHEKDIKIRWIDAYFPFTAPSWEMEVFFRGEWLELCGCGVIQQSILNRSGNSDKVGWAFGLGLERIAMFMFGIPDIRLFWSRDPRFLNQFSKGGKKTQFVPFSKYPVCYKDISFWCPEDYHENDLNDVVRSLAGSIVEDVKLIDTFEHPKTKKVSRCYRINYRTLENEEIDRIQEDVRKVMVARYGVELR